MAKADYLISHVIRKGFVRSTKAPDYIVYRIFDPFNFLVKILSKMLGPSIIDFELDGVDTHARVYTRTRTHTHTHARTHPHPHKHKQGRF